MSQEQSLSSPTPAMASPPGANVFLTLLPITLAVFIGFLTIGMQMPVLPLHLHETLGMGTLVIGLVIGLQFVVALLSRPWAGNLADLRGAKRAVVIGCLLAASSGLVYLASLAFVTTPTTSVWIVVLGRILLALGESLIATGALGWSLGLVGPRNAGKVMVWVGIAIYGAYALGAPLGVAVNAQWGFAGIAAAVVVIPFVALAVVWGVRAVAPSATRRTPFYKVLGAVLWPGMGLALSSVGFGLITAFIALLFAAKQWGNASLAFTAFGLAFIGARIFFGHLPDKLGGAKVALVSVAIEAFGQLFIWRADSASLAYAGAALTGFGYSLAYPGFGVEAVRRAPPQTRGLVMGAYVAFMDIALGLTSPLAGALAGAQGISSVYLAGAITVALALVIALRLLSDDSAATVQADNASAGSPAARNAGAIAISLLGLLVIFGGLYAWRAARAGGAAPPARAPALVSTVHVQPRTVAGVLQAVGSLQAVREVVLAPDTAGRVTALSFTAGQIVKEGATLVQLYDAPEQADRSAAEARANFAQLQLRRSQALASSGAEPRELLEQRKTEADQAAAAVRQLDARIQQKNIRAPFSGQLGIRRINLGQYLNAGEAIATLTQLDLMYVNFTLPQQELSRLALGARVQVTVDAVPGKIFDAKVSTIEPRIDGETRNVAVQAILSNTDNLLKSGMYAVAKLELPATEHAIALPLTAIQTSASGDSVVLVQEADAQGIGKAVAVPVITGRRLGDDVLVTQGVKSGDIVVVAGQNRLLPGGKVKINAASSEGTPR
ncbi:arabinose transporter [Serratia marcescens]|uniref:arabinose transporter n=1 Tax=Serratia marcescens TaxID=615 RepID=UPI003FA698AC